MQGSLISCAGAVAGRTRRLHAEDAARLHDLAAAAAIAARFRAVPGLAPVPLHSVQSSWRWNSTVLVTPRAASNRSTLSSQATSSPLRGRSRLRPSAAEQIAEHAVAEDFAEGLENIVDVGELMRRLPSTPAWP